MFDRYGVPLPSLGSAHVLPRNGHHAKPRSSNPIFARRDVERALTQVERYEAARRQRRRLKPRGGGAVGDAAGAISPEVAGLLDMRSKKRGKKKATRPFSPKGRRKPSPRLAMLVPAHLDCGGKERPYLPRGGRF